MDDFVMSDATNKARELSKSQNKNILPQANWQTNRRLIDNSLTSYPKGSGSEKLAVSDTGFIILADERIDVRNLHDIATPAQVNALAFMLRYLAKANENLSDMEAMALAMRGLERKRPAGNKVDAAGWIKNLFEQIGKEGINLVDTSFFTTMDRFMDLPRPFELLAAINRMRLVEWEQV